MILIELFVFFSTFFPIFHLLNALLGKRRRRAGGRIRGEKNFSVLIPCFNEEATLALSVEGLLALDYKNYEAIYINDGSVDNTLDVLNQLLDLQQLPRGDAGPKTVRGLYRSQKHPNIRVIDKPNGGKSDALNVGIFYAAADLIVTLDADSVLQKDALTHANRAFEDPGVVAAGGTIHIIQGYGKTCRRGQSKRVGMLVALQILEYIKGFYIYKMSLSRQRAMAIISGAFGVFRKSILLEAGGYRKSLGEDIDITMRIHCLIHKTGQQIVYLPEALCYTQCPENWRDLRRQRLRWQKGFIDCAVFQRNVLIKTFLFRSVSFHFFVEALLVGLCSCLFTVFCHAFFFVMLFVSVQLAHTFLLYYGFCVLFHLIYAFSAIAICGRYHRYPRHIAKQMRWAVVLDVLLYRYFSLFVYLGGTISYFWRRSGHNSWNKCERQKETYFALEL